MPVAVPSSTPRKAEERSLATKYPAKKPFRNGDPNTELPYKSNKYKYIRSDSAKRSRVTRNLKRHL